MASLENKEEEHSVCAEEICHLIKIIDEHKEVISQYRMQICEYKNEMKIRREKIEDITNELVDTRNQIEIYLEKMGHLHKRQSSQGAVINKLYDSMRMMQSIIETHSRIYNNQLRPNREIVWDCIQCNTLVPLDFALSHLYVCPNILKK